MTKPASYKDDIETSSHLKLCGKAADEQEVRRQELELLGLWERARWVRDCGSKQYPCGLRGWCPQCSWRIAVVNGGRAAAGMLRMETRLVGLFVMPVSWDADERGKGSRVMSFRNDIGVFRDAIKEIRRRKCFRPVVGGVEFFEFELSEHGRSWNLHCHVVLDVAALDPAEVEITFKQLTEDRGWFSLPPDHEDKIVTTDNIDRTAMYFAKPATWSPEPGTLARPQLYVLQQAIKGVQMVITWGTASAPKIPKAKGDRVTTNVPKAKRPKRVPFFFYTDQLELVEAAITRAAELSNSDVRSNNLAFVCMNYLATNDFNFYGDEQRLRFVAMCERFTGYKFIVWNPTIDVLVHGYDTLKCRNGTDGCSVTSRDPPPIEPASRSSTF